MTGHTLILNAAEGSVQLVLARGSEMLCAEEWRAPAQATELLAPLLADILRHGHLQPKEITRLACVAGPGSFTGLRLVLTTAAAFRRVTGAKTAVLNTLGVLAAGLPWALLSVQGINPILVRVITHARRGLVHGQDFWCGSALPIPASEPAMWPLAAACMDPLPRFMIGSGVSRNIDFLRGQLAGRKECQLVPEELDQPVPRALLALVAALPDTAWQCRDPEPLYLRPCDAIENLTTIAAMRGQDPAEAHSRLDTLLGPINPTQIQSS